jgi:hypothetical protein
LEEGRGDHHGLEDLAALKLPPGHEEGIHEGKAPIRVGIKAATKGPGS